MNRSIAEKVAARVQRMLKNGATVAVLGLSYKPFSHVTEESQGVYVARQLARAGFRVVAFDPMAAEMDLDDIKRDIVILGSIAECLSQSEAVLVTTPDPAFKALTASDFKNQWSEVLVFDFWRILAAELRNREGIKYVGIGMSEDDTANTKVLKRLWWGEPGDTAGKAID